MRSPLGEKRTHLEAGRSLSSIRQLNDSENQDCMYQKSMQSWFIVDVIGEFRVTSISMTLDFHQWAQCNCRLGYY